IFVNGKIAASGFIAAAGSFSITVPPLVAGQEITATQTVSGVTSVPSAALTVVARPAPPVITIPLVDGSTTIGGTGVGSALVEVFISTASAGTTVAGSTGAWNLSLSSPLVAGQGVQ